MGNHFSKPEWRAFPWRRWTSPARQLKVLPTFVVCEWAFRLLNLACLRHAIQTRQIGLWLSAWIAGTANDARRDSAEDFSRLNALLCTAMGRILIPAYCFAIP